MNLFERYNKRIELALNDDELTDIEYMATKDYIMERLNTEEVLDIVSSILHRKENWKIEIRKEGGDIYGL